MVKHSSWITCSRRPGTRWTAAGNVLEKLAIRDGFPMLDEHLQTSIPGLFVTGMAAVQDFGPFWAFTIAARASAQIIGRAFSLRCRADSDRNCRRSQYDHARCRPIFVFPPHPDRHRNEIIREPPKVA
jgi:hypothetical protein